MVQSVCWVRARRYARRYAKPLAIGALLARLRAEPRTGSLRLVKLAALLAHLDAP